MNTLPATAIHGENRHTLLIVDDDREIRSLLAEQLEKVGYSVATAANGAEMFALLSNTAIDLIILDLNLPRITGLGVLERYHSKDTPIVVFSASSMQTDKEFALALGASDYVQKPIDLQAFTEAVCEIVNKWAGRKGSVALVS